MDKSITTLIPEELLITTYTLNHLEDDKKLIQHTVNS